MSNAPTEETVIDVEHYTDRLFSFNISRPKSFRFRSGEFIMIGLPALPSQKRPIMRAYSVASPSWDESLEFFSIKVPDGPLTSRLQKIKKGDTVGLMYASASFDEEIFDKPFEFNIERKPNRHLAFGTGPHQCLGLILARLEMRVFFEQLIPRIAEMELVGDPERVRASFVHGLKHMNIRYRLTD